MIPCKQCGENNPIDRVLCLRCGTKLEKSGPGNITPLRPKPLKPLAPPQESLAGTLLTYLFFGFLFIALCLFFYSGLIPEPVLSLSSARNLDQKLLLLKQNEPYVSLNQEELNIYLEREWNRAKDSITARLPSFITLKRIFLTLKDHDLTLYLHFTSANIPVFISFTGTLCVEDRKIRLLVSKSSIGALRLPVLVTRTLLNPVLRECRENKRLDLPPGIQNLDITESTLFAYQTPQSGNASKNVPETQVSSDLLLVQAADVCLSKNEKDKAEKYLRLALLHYPGTPLKSRIQEQLRLLAPKKEENP